MENFTFIVSNLVSSVVGFGIGYFVRMLFEKKGIEFDQRKIVLGAVTFVWCISMLVSIAFPTYQTPQAVHGLMIAIVGFLFRVDDIFKGKK